MADVKVPEIPSGILEKPTEKSEGTLNKAVPGDLILLYQRKTKNWKTNGFQAHLE